MENQLKEIKYGEIILPAEIHAAVGRECRLWWSTIAVVEEGDRSVYFEIRCDVGRTTARGFDITPVKAQIGSHDLWIRTRDIRTRAVIDEKNVRLIITDCDSVEGEKSILMIGDSRTWHSVSGPQGEVNVQTGNKATTTELKRLLDESKGARFSFLGHYVSALDASVRNLADNGWKYETAYNHFVNAGGVKKYLQFCSDDENVSLDYVTIMYGINDLSDWHQNLPDQFERCVKKFDSIVDYAKKLIDLINSDYPECKIVLVLESSCAGNQDGYGYWGCSDNDCMMEIEFAVKALRKRIISEFDCGRYASNVILSAAGLWCDRIYGFPYEMVTPNSRSNDRCVLRLVNCVHPHDVGYKQIADGYFSTIKYLENKQ